MYNVINKGSYEVMIPQLAIDLVTVSKDITRTCIVFAVSYFIYYPRFCILDTYCAALSLILHTESP